MVPGCSALPATVLAISPLPRSFIFLKDLNFLSFFWLCRLFVSMHAFSLVAANWGCTLVAVSEFLIAEVSRCRAQALGRVGFKRSGEWAQWFWLLGPGALAQQLWYTGLVAQPHVGSS